MGNGLLGRPELLELLELLLVLEVVGAGEVEPVFFTEGPLDATLFNSELNDTVRLLLAGAWLTGGLTMDWRLIG